MLPQRQRTHLEQQRTTCRTFTLHSWDIHTDHFLDAPLYGPISYHTLFWTTHGQRIKTLTLSKCKIPYNFTLIPADFWMAVPNLERLRLLSCEMVLVPEKNVPMRTNHSERVKLVHAISLVSGNQISDLFDKLVRLPVDRQEINLKTALMEYQTTFRMLVTEYKEIRNEFVFMLEFEEEQAIQRLRWDLEDFPSSLGCKLKFLHVQNLNCGHRAIPIEGSKIMNLFPSLEHIFLQGQEACEFETTSSPVPIDRKLKELDVMSITSCIDQISNDTVLRLPTEKLSFDCGLQTDREKVCSVLKAQANGLKQLSLFRAPFAPPYSRFPCDFVMGNLTKLYLWGNVSRNLNFLRLTPSLKILQWSTLCYDRKTHGARLHGYFNRKMYMLLSEWIVQDTDKLDDNFKLESLKVLDLEVGTLSWNSLQKLGKWLPNLKQLTTAVTGDAELAQIGNQWDKLESLVLTQASMFTAEGIQSLTWKRFPVLKRFTWKSCPCFQETSVKRKRCYKNARRARERSHNAFWCNGNCLPTLFEAALIFGGNSAEMFKQALLKIPT